MSANPERGEVSLVVPGRNGEADRTYTLKLSMNVAVALQKRLKKTIGEILAETSRLDFEAIRTCAWLLLQKYHKDEFKTEDAVGDLIDDAGGAPVFFDLIGQLNDTNKAPDEGNEGDAKGPQQAQADGISGVSTSSGDAQA